MATESRIISIISSLHNKVVSPTNQSLQLNQVHLPSQFPGKAIDMRVLHFTVTTKELEFQAFLCRSLWACGACVCVHARACVLGCTWIIKWRCDIFFLFFPFCAVARSGPALMKDLSTAMLQRAVRVQPTPPPPRRTRGCTEAVAACLRLPPWLPGGHPAKWISSRPEQAD